MPFFREQYGDGGGNIGLRDFFVFPLGVKLVPSLQEIPFFFPVKLFFVFFLFLARFCTAGQKSTFCLAGPNLYGVLEPAKEREREILQFRGFWILNLIFFCFGGL